MNELRFLKVEQVMEQMQISRAMAYRIMRKLNSELDAKGYITVQGRVDKEYFYNRCSYSGKEA